MIVKKINSLITLFIVLVFVPYNSNYAYAKDKKDVLVISPSGKQRPGQTFANNFKRAKSYNKLRDEARELRNQGKFEEALKVLQYAYEEVASNSFDFHRAIEGMAIIYEVAGDFELAANFYSERVRMDEGKKGINRTRLQYFIYKAQSMKDKFAKGDKTKIYPVTVDINDVKEKLPFVSESFERSMSEDNELSVTPKFWLAFVYMKNGMFKEAIPSIEYSAVLAGYKTKEPNQYTSLGYCYSAEGNFDTAQKHFLKALEYDHNRTEDIYLLGQHFLKLNQPEKARDLYNQALAITPDSKITQALNALLDQQ